MPGIWTSSTTFHPSISWPIDGVFRIGFVISWRPEITTLLTALPRAPMFILIVGVAHTKAFVLDLTPPAASKRHKGRIATDPLLTTRRFHQRRRGIATEAAMLTGNRLGFHPVVCHSVSLSDSGRGSVLPGARLRGVSHSRSLSPIRSPSSQPETLPMASGNGGGRKRT